MSETDETNRLRAAQDALIAYAARARELLMLTRDQAREHGQIDTQLDYELRNFLIHPAPQTCMICHPEEHPDLRELTDALPRTDPCWNCRGLGIIGVGRAHAANASSPSGSTDALRHVAAILKAAGVADVLGKIITATRAQPEPVYLRDDTVLVGDAAALYREVVDTASKQAAERIALGHGE